MARDRREREKERKRERERKKVVESGRREDGREKDRLDERERREDSRRAGETLFGNLYGRDRRDVRFAFVRDSDRSYDYLP